MIRFFSFLVIVLSVALFVVAVGSESAGAALASLLPVISGLWGLDMDGSKIL